MYPLSDAHTDIIRSYLLANDPCMVRGWWKLACPFFKPEGTGLKFFLSCSFRTLNMDSISPNFASVIGRGIPFLCQL